MVVNIDGHGLLSGFLVFFLNVYVSTQQRVKCQNQMSKSMFYI